MRMLFPFQQGQASLAVRALMNEPSTCARRSIPLGQRAAVSQDTTLHPARGETRSVFGPKLEADSRSRFSAADETAITVQPSDPVGDRLGGTLGKTGVQRKAEDS